MKKFRVFLVSSLLLHIVSLFNIDANPNFFWENILLSNTDSIKELVFDKIQVDMKGIQELGIKGIVNDQKEKIIINYPKLLISSNSFTFLQGNHIVKSIVYGDDILTFPILSPNRLKMGTFQAKLNPNEKISESTMLSVVNSRGEAIVNRSFNQSLQFVINDEGDYVAFNVGEDGIGTYLYFYNALGALIKKVKPFSSGYFSYKASFNSLGDKLIICFDKFGSFGGAIIVYSHRGVELCRKIFAKTDYIISQLAISSNDQYFYFQGVIINESSPKGFSILMNIIGDTLINFNLAKQGTFSSDGNFLAISSNNKITLIDIGKKQYIWQQEIEDDRFSINCVAVSNRSYFVAISARNNQKIQEKIIKVFDKYGQINLAEKVSSNDKIEKIITQFDTSGQLLYFLHGNKLKAYKLAGESG